MTRRPVRPTLGGLLVAGLLGGVVGCGGGSTDAAPTPGPTSQPTVSTPASTPATPTTSLPTTTPADPAAYLPVPDGRTLTAPGTELRFGESALAAWTPRQGLVGVVGVEVEKVEKTSVRRSLAGFELDAAALTSTPYFVSLKVGNGGDTDLGGRQLPIYAIDSADRLVAPTGVAQDFRACPGSLLPAIFAPDDRARSCLIFLVPRGATLASVTFRPPEGVVPLTWTGRVRALGSSGDGSPIENATPTDDATMQDGVS